MKLALIGKEVSRSKSKRIHEMLIGCRYDLLSVEEKDFGKTVDLLKCGYDGFNVTMPYKEKILDYLDDATDEVIRVKSCNTVKIVNGKLFGATTDGIGLVESLRGFLSAKEKSVLLLGAGGAAKSICYALYQAGYEVSVWNRTASRAIEMIKALALPIRAAETETLQNTVFDVVINATSVGMTDENTVVDLNRMPRPNAVIDIIYRDTALLRAARKLKIKTMDGLAMLVYQAAEADKIFCGQSPHTQKVTQCLNALREETL